MDITKPITPRRAEIADKAYERLLDVTSKVSPELTEMLRKKYEEERQEFAKAAQDATPSQDPDYWAKTSCPKCYGRGIIGKRHIFMPGTSAITVRGEGGEKVLANSVTKLDIRCKCVNKGYAKWLATFRRFYNMLKAQAVADALVAAESGETEDAT